MNATTLSSAPLSNVGFPPGTYRLGAGVIPAAECLEMLRAGMACPLAVTNARGQTGFYWLSVLTDGKGTTVGYRLLVDGPDGIMYDVTTDFVCDCPGSTMHGHCKHGKCCRSLKERGLLS